MTGHTWAIVPLRSGKFRGECECGQRSPKFVDEADARTWMDGHVTAQYKVAKS